MLALGVVRWITKGVLAVRGRNLDFARLDRAFASIDSWAAQNLKIPVAQQLVNMGVTANGLNAMGFAGCAAAGLLSYRRRYRRGAVLFLCSAALDVFDGTVAKIEGSFDVNHLGGWQDAFGGFVGEATYVAALLSSGDRRVTPSLAAVSMWSVAVGSYCKAVAGEYNVPVDWPESRIIGRGARIFVLSLPIMAAPEESLVGPLRMYVGTANLILLERLVRIFFSKPEVGV